MTGAVRRLRVWCIPLREVSTDPFRWSPSVRIEASQSTAVPPQLRPRCVQWRGICRSKTAGKPILTICPMSRATPSTRSVMLTKSLVPRISWACCATCTRTAPSAPTRELLGSEHTNCTLGPQRTVDPKLRPPPSIKLVDFLYGEWGGVWLIQNLLWRIAKKITVFHASRYAIVHGHRHNRERSRKQDVKPFLR